MSDLRRYTEETSVVFNKTRERWGELSNMAADFPLRVCGVDWNTSEALYQACRFPDLPEIQRLILREKSPMAAKMKSKPHRARTRDDWERARVKIMRWVLRVKLAQHFDKFSAILLCTGDLPIVERSHKDKFWGAVPIEAGVLEGENVLGRLLMELREEVLHRPFADLLCVEPPAVPNVRLLGETVPVVSAKDAPPGSARLF